MALLGEARCEVQSWDSLVEEQNEVKLLHRLALRGLVSSSLLALVPLKR